jgi:putative nucleotidyltransferase with HDIG domain
MKTPHVTKFETALPPAADAAVSIVRRLQEAGHQAFLVGGAVRDLLMHRQAGDFDVATDAVPERIESLFPGSRFVGASFGVSLIKIENAAVETATFRIESDYLDGRHPASVSFTTDVAADSRRRDFTINALYMDPIRQEILDFHGGRNDCADRILRTVGKPSDRFREDGLRLMRAARFAADCDLEIAGSTLNSMRENREMMNRIASERIGLELKGMLTGHRPDRALNILLDTGILEIILPDLSAMHGVPQPPQFHPEGCVWTHTMLMLQLADAPSLRLALSILLHDVGKPATFTETDRIRFHGHAHVGAEMAERILLDLKFPGDLTRDVCRFVSEHLKFLDAGHMRPSTLKRFMRQDHFDELMELHRLDMMSSNQDMSHWEFCRQQLAVVGRENLHPRPLLSGSDLLKMGYPPGPGIGEILAAVETRQLDGELGTREEAVDWIGRRFQRR